MIGPWLRFLFRFPGVSRGRYPLKLRLRRDWLRGILLLRGVCRSLVVVLLGAERVCCGGPPLKELSGGNWMTDCGGHSLAGAARSPVGQHYFGEAVPSS